MSNDSSKPRLPADVESAEDIEILEVVGLDEDGAPIDASDPDDVEVLFDEAEAVETPDPSGAPDAGTGEATELRERLMRLQADFENFKKRMERERFDHFRYATVALVGRILPVLDNFERAMSAARPGESSNALVEGVALIQRQLLAELEAEGLRSMDSVGELFDPELHDAVATDPDSPLPAHTVTHVFQRGYFLHDRVLRPALVRVRVDTSEGDPSTSEQKES